MKSVNLIHINQLSSKLKQILKSELTKGNIISETSKGWPKESSVFIVLSQPFKEKYNLESVKFEEINDKHYWKAEYRDLEANHLLVCKF